MNAKKLSVFTVIIIVVTLGVFLVKNKKSKPDDSKIGQSIASIDQLQKLSKITLKSSESDEVSIEKSQNGDWTISNYHHIPVDFEKLTQFTNSLQENKIERFVSEYQSVLDRLNLTEKSILLGNDSQTTMIQVGNNGKSGGTFIQFGDTPKAYITVDTINLDVSQNNWAEKQPLKSLQVDNIKAFKQYQGDKVAYHFYREKKEDSFLSDNTPEGKEINQSEISSTIRDLISLRFTNTKELNDSEVVAGKEHFKTYEITTFAGNETYKIQIGRKPEEKQTVEVEAKEGEEKKTEERTIPAGSVVLQIQFPQMESIWNQAQEKIALIASSYSFTQFENRQDKFFQDLPKKEENKE